MRVILLAISLVYLQGCLTTKDTGQVNLNQIEDVYTSTPQTSDYSESGQVSSQSSGFFWDSCAKVCKKAVRNLKYEGKDMDGDSIVELRFNNEGRMTKKPTCVTTWGWAVWTYGLGLAAPWIQTCEVEGTAVKRMEGVAAAKKAQQNQSLAPTIIINNSNNQGVPAKPAH